jgi:putative acetyltransferase
MSRVGTIGISVHPDYQRRGIGTRLLKECIALAKKQNLRRLEADTLANNKPMRRLAQEVGFRFEGVRKMRIKKNNRYLDEALLALTLS